VAERNRLRLGGALRDCAAGMATGAIPLAPNGLGTFEVQRRVLYQHLPNGMAALPSAGFVVALGYRLITVLIA